MHANTNAQMTLRGNTAHVQIGNKSNYSKKDFPATSEIVNYFKAQVAKGNFAHSFAGSDTKYVPVKVVEETKTVYRIVGESCSEVTLHAEV